MTAWIERIAERYLQHRGRFVVPRTFFGIVVGYGNAYEIERGQWSVSLHPQAPNKVVALNHSLVQTDVDARFAELLQRYCCCGECRLAPGEVCDICGRTQRG